jgi:hypothetical protein
LTDHCNKYASTLNFQLGDVIELLHEADINEKTKKEDWLYGRCERTKQKGQFPFDAVYVLPTYERPPTDFLVYNPHSPSNEIPDGMAFFQQLFKAMSLSETNTLPKKRGVVVLSKGTIGRHGGFGLDTSA